MLYVLSADKCCLSKIRNQLCPGDPAFPSQIWGQNWCAGAHPWRVEHGRDAAGWQDDGFCGARDLKLSSTRIMEKSWPWIRGKNSFLKIEKNMGVECIKLHTRSRDSKTTRIKRGDLLVWLLQVRKNSWSGGGKVDLVSWHPPWPDLSCPKLLGEMSNC